MRRTLTRKKYSSVCSGNISSLSFGLQAGWLSPLQPALQSDDSPLGAPPLTIEEISWIGSLPSISLIVCSPMFGYLMNRFGRKKACFIATAPNILNYLLLIFANNVYMVYVARLIGGFCSTGGFIVAPVYINETCQTRWRGFLGGLMGAFIKVGIIVSYIIGAYMSYFMLNLISMLFTLFFVVCYLWMPESPVYLMTIDKREEAKKSLVKMRGEEYTGVDKEISQIEYLINEVQGSTGKYTTMTFFKTRATRKALLIVCGVYTVQMLGGYPAIVRYTVDIFRRSDSTISPRMAAIMLGVAQLVSSIVGASLMERLGRKFLLLLFTFTMSISLLSFSSYLFLKSAIEDSSFAGVLKFVPIGSMMVYISSYATAYGSVPFVLVPELFAPEARASGAAFSNLWISFLEFIVVKMFPTVTEYIGLLSSLLIFSGNCAVGLIFLQFAMFETKGLEFEVVYKRLIGKKTEKGNSFEGKALDPLITNPSEKNSLKV